MSPWPVSHALLAQVEGGGRGEAAGLGCVCLWGPGPASGGLRSGPALGVPVRLVCSVCRAGPGP